MQEVVMNITKLIDDTMKGVDELDAWCDKIYQDNFGDHFKEVRKLRAQMDMAERFPIPDADLEMILIDLPLELISALESVHRLRTHQELMKFNAKYRVREESPPTASKADRDEITAGMLAVAKAYENIIERADREIAYCRELIMGAKKIWDARRNAENANPVSETTKKSKKDKPLPEYIK